MAETSSPEKRVGGGDDGEEATLERRGKKREEARRGGIAVKEAEAIIEKEKPGCRGKDMNVVNGGGGKGKRRRGGEEDGEVNGRTREGEKGAVWQKAY